MATQALAKVVSWILIIFTVVLVIVYFLFQTGVLKSDILEKFIDNQKTELEELQGGSNDPSDSALLRSRNSALEIYQSLDVSNDGICRVEPILPELLGNSKTDDYTYHIKVVDNEIRFIYQDVVQGMSFNVTPNNIKRVYLVQDIQSILSHHDVANLLETVGNYQGTAKMEFLQTNERLVGHSYYLDEKEGSELLIYEDGEIEFNMPGIENPFMTNLWRTPFRINDALIFVDGTTNDVLKTGFEESDKIDEINATKICGG